MIEYLVVGGVALAAGWIGRGAAMLRKAQKDGKELTLVESVRLVVVGGRA